MEHQRPISERKNMDNCLRRLKQELLSMKEAGDGLHAQMNSMMGALQELKLLQVQTALEQLEISASAKPRGQPAAPPAMAPPPTLSPNPREEQRRPTNPREEQRRSQHRRSLDTSPSSSSTESGSFPHPRRLSRDSAPSWEEDQWGARPGTAVAAAGGPQRSLQMVDLPAILHSLSREGPSLDSDFSQDSADDGSDWTSSLMSRSRNRQPLVLGDNIFADLVGNWLDLPELEKCPRGGGEEGGAAGDEPAHPLRLTRSQEICRKFSLTANIFRKFLRSVRPDRDKLLKEKPGWMPLDDDPQAELFKRPKKASKTKGTFYLPFRAGGAGGGHGQQGKGRPCPRLPEERAPISGIYVDRGGSEFEENTPPVFDYNTAVWV